MRLKILAASAALLTAACATAPTYHARTDGDRYGYSEMQLEGNRFRINYNGDTLTSRETVETYLLYRAAESTIERGYDYFIITAHDVDENSRYNAIGPLRPRFGGATIREVSSANAAMDVVMFEGVRPPALPNAYDAHAIQTNLAPRVTATPTQR